MESHSIEPYVWKHLKKAQNSAKAKIDRAGTKNW